MLTAEPDIIDWVPDTMRRAIDHGLVEQLGPDTFVTTAKVKTWLDEPDQRLVLLILAMYRNELPHDG